jgi:zinc protease
MHLLRRGLFAFLLCLAIPLHAATGDSGWLYRGSDIAPDPAWQFGTLPNGARYAVRRNALPAGQVSIRIRIDAGSMNESDAERGWAHFVEHLAFRGTRNFGDGEGRRIWQELGASFGSDTNATTTPSQTVYQLDLPHADRAALDRSLAILSDMMDNALFAPEAVDAERKIVLAEKRRRSELAVRYDQIARPLFYAGLKYAVRDPIGTDETLGAATAQALRAFYERWYRPDRATIIMTGDADPAMMAELIAKHFSAWQPDGQKPAEPDYGRIARDHHRVGTLTYPGAPASGQVMWIRPHDTSPDTVASERVELMQRIAAQIINRRLEAKARGEASFLNASVGIGRTRRVADSTQLSISAKEGLWAKALDESMAIIADSLRAPPSPTEIAREVSNLRIALVTGVAAEPTVKSPQRASQMVSAINSGDVVAEAQTMLTLLDQFTPSLTPQAIAGATRQLFAGEGPRILLLTPTPVQGGEAAVAAALTHAEKTAPATRQAERKVSFDLLPALGEPGRELSRQRIDDLDVTIVRFANGSTLTFKKTDFDKGSVLVRLRFGEGIAGLPANKKTLAWMGDAVGPSGLTDLDLDGMERLMTGRRINLDFNVDEDAFELAGTTNAADLPDQMRLLAVKLAYPRWDPTLFNRYKTSWIDNYEMNFASASARARRELGGQIHPGDARWQPVDRTAMDAAEPGGFRAFFAPILATGPVEAIIVGDVDLEAAVKAVADTIGALPARPAPAAPIPVAPPRPNPVPGTFTHKGDPSQAFALIGWSTFGGTARIEERRALSVAANILEVRLFDRLREKEGATYAPNVSATSAEIFPAWGVFFAAAELKPESTDTFFRIAREEIAALANTPAPPKEFARAQNPIVTGVERRLKTNGYWIAALENWTTRPELIEQTRNYLSDYKAMTAEKVRAAVAAYVTDEGDWSMLVLPEKAARKAPAGGN